MQVLEAAEAMGWGEGGREGGEGVCRGCSAAGGCGCGCGRGCGMPQLFSLAVTVCTALSMGCLDIYVWVDLCAVPQAPPTQEREVYLGCSVVRGCLDSSSLSWGASTAGASPGSFSWELACPKSGVFAPSCAGLIR